ncbi:MAG: A/G-specific adenine glycosylase [Bacteroidota bacterium]
MSFSEKILLWYAENKRTLPWRTTRDPYKIWLSEVILQQTRVVQGTPYYLKFIEHFPTVHDLATAHEDQVLKLWQGLGYYSRARNLHAAAKTVVDQFGGHFPESYTELLTLKGVGDYTASAISSICFNEPRAVVDGNVYRVLARYFGVDMPINTSPGMAYFKQLATEVMDPGNIRDYNQGIMEFGALQCAPKKPYCLLCPLCESCVALSDNRVAQLPVKLGKTKITKRYFNYMVPLDTSGGTIMQQRKEKGIWRNLWEFPLLESEGGLSLDKVKSLLSQVFPQTLPVKQVYAFNQEPLVHKLSHQHLYTRFWIVRVEGIIRDSLALEQVEQLAVPVLIADFIKALKNSYF